MRFSIPFGGKIPLYWTSMALAKMGQGMARTLVPSTDARRSDADMMGVYKWGIMGTLVS